MLHSFIEWLGTTAIHFITAWGHWGIFLGMILESTCIPLPSEVIMPFGGFMAEKGKLLFWLVLVSGIAGNLVGSLVAYWIGKKGGRPFLERYGKMILLRQSHLDQAEKWFSKYGDWIILFGRNLPLIRTFLSLPAGIAKMKITRFVVFTLIGSIPWNVALTFIGWKLGQHWQNVQPYLHPIAYALVAVIVIWVLWFIYKNVKRKAQC
ncbi:MAG: DedA family protein [Tuberibacillus sp.]